MERLTKPKPPQIVPLLFRCILGVMTSPLISFQWAHTYLRNEWKYILEVVVKVWLVNRILHLNNIQVLQCMHAAIIEIFHLFLGRWACSHCSKQKNFFFRRDQNSAHNGGLVGVFLGFSCLVGWLECYFCYYFGSVVGWWWRVMIMAYTKVIEKK